MAVTVFERVPEICEVGAGLSLWSNAVTALRRLELESRITELGSPVARMQVVTASGQMLSQINIEELSRKAGDLLRNPDGFVPLRSGPNSLVCDPECPGRNSGSPAGTSTRFSQLSRDGIPCSALSSRRPMSRPS